MCRVRASPRPTVGPVPVSSLVFVVIVAIWAAYLVQHWARRREDAAATRSMEDFSEAMRVLEKRPALPTTELSTPRPHSYAVKPASAGRTMVDVKRAVPAGASRRSSPLVARRGHHAHAVSTPRPGSGSPSLHADHDNAPYAEVDRMPQTARPTSVPVSRRRLRAALLLLALLWLPTSVVLTLTGVLMWVSVPFAVLTIAAVLVWLRAEARGDRSRSAARSSVESAQSYAYSGRPAAERAQRERGPRREGRQPAFLPVVSVEDTQVIRSSVVTLEPATVSAPNPAPHVAAVAAAVPGRAAAQSVFDVQALATGPVAVAAAPAAPAPEGSWSPVPVPPPTYVLKAKAEPRWTDSGIPADVFDTPEFAEEADELDDRALFARRAVSQ